MARPHAGQIDTAANLRTLMRGSWLTVEHPSCAARSSRQCREGSWSPVPSPMQKAYSLRAMPQVLGASATH